MASPLGECSNGVNVSFNDSDDDEFPNMSAKHMKQETKRRICKQFAFKDLLAMIDLEIGNKTTKLKEKLTKLSQDDMDMPWGIVAPDTDYDASISGLEADFPKWVNDDAIDEANEVEFELKNEEEVAIIFAELDQAYEEDVVSHLDEEVVLEEVGI
ncbi:hypothetical protein Tco_0505897 [Tanacetum coccineum]